MSPRFFLTGATGYVGGDILHQIAQSFPSAPIVALVRDKARARKIETTYPQVSLLEGDLDSQQLIEDEVARSDIVINTANAKYLPAVDSIAKGIEKTHKDKPTLWLQISGASLLSIPDIKNKSFGEASDKIYNDLDNAADIRKLIDENPSRTVDHFVLNFARAHAKKVKTALIYPPIIYGEGRGQGNTRSIQIPSLCKIAIDKKESVYIGKGEARWGNVHIADLSGLVSDLVKASLESRGQDDFWNENGLYCPATGEITWKAIAQGVSQAAGANDVKAATKPLAAEDFEKLFPHGSVLFGTNARSEPGRGSKLVGYKATQHSLEEEIAISFRRELGASKDSNL